MSASEAAALWGKAPITVQQACKGYGNIPPRMKPTEARKSGKTWLVTRTGMERVFGPLDGKNTAKMMMKGTLM